MKKLFLTVLLTLLVSVPSLQAVPAHKGSVTINQPDGTTVTIRLHGDEYLHFTTTDDGYSVVKNELGYYVYAQRGKDGQLEPTRMVAHDAALRQQAEQHFLQSIAKYQAPDMLPDVRKELMAERARQQQTRRAAAAGAPKYDYNNFRGLVILVEYKDKAFSRDDYNQIMDDMINKEGYTGYKNVSGRTENFTGSVRDYFSDNSDGQFQPEFDVFGPYKINYSQYDARGSNNANALLNAAVRVADDEIDFSNYDRDGDGVVDMIYFIFAGNGANYSGNDSRLWWPHRSVVVSSDYRSYLEKDGVVLWDYASSVELYGYTGYPSSVTIDGIGTICHEFSHVLGLPDFYDADYEQGGGQSNDPGEWSVMAGGSYNNNGRTPVGYGLFERYAVGFATPEVINATGSYTLDKLAATNSGYRINSNDKSEFFILENRQQSGWDAYLPGHGMLVFRVDSSSVNIWDRNEVNNNPNHNYYELVRANGWQGRGAGSDAFPGTKNVRTLNNETSPASLMTWSKNTTPWGLENIRESNGVVTFDVVDVNILKSITLPSTLQAYVGVDYQLNPEFHPISAPHQVEWKSDNEDVVVVDANGILHGLALGTATITVTGSNGVQAQSVVTVSDILHAENIATLQENGAEQVALLDLTDAQVTYVYRNEVFLRDATASMVLPENPLELSAGNVLNGKLLGKLQYVDGMPTFIISEMADLDRKVQLSDGKTVSPREIELTNLSARDYADLITLKGITFEVMVYEGQNGLYTHNDDLYVRLYNTFGVKGISISDYDGKYYDATGVLTKRKLSSGALINELALIKSPVQVEAPMPSSVSELVVDQSTQRSYYTVDGRKVEGHVIPSGLYIIRQGGTTKKVVVK